MARREAILETDLPGVIKMRNYILKTITIFILLLVLPAHARRIRESSSPRPAGFVEQISVEPAFILDSSIQSILNTEAQGLIQDLHTGRREIDKAIEKMRTIIWGMIEENELIQDKISGLIQTEFVRRQESEPPLDPEERNIEEGRLQGWYQAIVYDILSRRFARIMKDKIDALLPKIRAEEREFFIDLKGKINEELLGIYIAGESSKKIPDKFWKAIRRATKKKDFFLVTESLASLFSMQGINKENILSIWVNILSREADSDSTKAPPRGRGSYRYRITIHKDGKVISTELILKLFMNTEEKIDELTDTLNLIKKLSTGLPHILPPGAYIRDVVWTEEDPQHSFTLAFTQKSLLRTYIVSLTQARQQLKESQPDVLISLETAIIREALHFWKETKRNIRGEEKGLLVSVWPGRISVWQAGANFEFRFLGIDHTKWVSLEEVIQELRNRGYHSQAIEEALKDF